MNIKIDTSTIIKIKIGYDSLIELHKMEALYSGILSRIFLNKAALIVTIEPKKKYSLGFEIGHSTELKIGKHNFLINVINECSSLMLSEISQSEEFSRGLLLLMTSDTILSENIENIIKHIHNNLGFEDFPFETVYCDSDGKSLCLYNTKLSKEDLLSVVEAFKKR